MDYLPRNPADGQRMRGRRTTKGGEKRVGSGHPLTNKKRGAWSSREAVQYDDISSGEMIRGGKGKEMAREGSRGGWVGNRRVTVNR